MTGTDTPHLIGRTVLARFQPGDGSFARPETWIGVAVRTTDRWEVQGIDEDGAAVIRQVAEPRTLARVWPGQYRAI